MGSERSPQDLAAVDAYLENLRLIVVQLADDDLFDPGRALIVSAGGSKFFDRVIAALGRDADFGGHSTTLVLRSGCYLIHDHGIYAAATPLGSDVPEAERLQPAAELWAEVLSCPEPGLAIVGLGRRDASFDAGLPVLLDGGGQLVKLDDQHAYLAFDPAAEPFRVGDRLAFGISHPCTTFDKWRHVLMLDDDGQVTDVLQTEFH